MLREGYKYGSGRSLSTLSVTQGAGGFVTGYWNCMKITLALIEQGKSERGGWTRAQVELLGGTWPLKDGWQHRLVGREITVREFDRFLSLTGEYVPRKNPRKERRSVVKSDLPIPPGFPVKVETVLASAWLFITRLNDPGILKKTGELLLYMARKTLERAERH